MVGNKCYFDIWNRYKWEQNIPKCVVLWNMKLNSKYKIGVLLKKNNIINALIIGYIIFSDSESGDSIILNSIEINPEYRNQGYGSEILNWLKIYAPQYMKKRIELSIESHFNQATKFFIKNNFVPKMEPNYSFKNSTLSWEEFLIKNQCPSIIEFIYDTKQ